MREGPRARFALLLLLVWVPVRPIEAETRQSNSLAEVFHAISAGQVNVVDLTHSLDEQSPYWPEGKTSSPFHASVAATFKRNGYFAREVAMPEHFGTHMDAPAHFDPQGMSVDQIPIANFLNRAI